MLVESTGVTTRRLEELMKRMQDENIKEQISIDEYLTGTWLFYIYPNDIIYVHESSFHLNNSLFPSYSAPLY